MSYPRSDAPSGEALPLVLREKLRLLQRDPPPLPASAAATDHNRVFTARELEDELWKTSQEIVSVQKQIQRGEELYYEETQAYGNVFRGWDGFIDARGDVLGNSSSSNHAQGGGIRRMPNDHRWFSGSATRIQHHWKPEPMSSHVTATTAALKPVVKVRPKKSEGSKPKGGAEAAAAAKASSKDDEQAIKAPASAPEPPKRETKRKAASEPAAASKESEKSSTKKEPAPRRTKRRRR